MAEKKEKEKDVIVVAELPQQPMRKLIDNDGTETDIITFQEALTEILKTVRKLEKSIG